MRHFTEYSESPRPEGNAPLVANISVTGSVTMPRSARPQAETDLYPPLFRYLTDQGYTVRSEVKHSDVTATKGDDLIIIELKRTFGTALLVQAIKRSTSSGP